MQWFASLYDDLMFFKLNLSIFLLVCVMQRLFACYCTVMFTDLWLYLSFSQIPVLWPITVS